MCVDAERLVRKWFGNSCLIEETSCIGIHYYIIKTLFNDIDIMDIIEVSIIGSSTSRDGAWLDAAKRLGIIE